MLLPIRNLASLHRLKSKDDQRRAWRKGLLSLSELYSGSEMLGALDGLPRSELTASMRAAIASQLIDDRDWLAVEASGMALYAIALSLPAGLERRELGLRTMQALSNGTAKTVSRIMTLAAQTGGPILNRSSIAARMTLSLSLPLSMDTGGDTLALALLSRDESIDRWLVQASSASLPERRLAARLLERAAAESGRRLELGDDLGPRIFSLAKVREAMESLLADREPLVWRSTAVARGLLVTCLPDLATDIVHNLQPSHGPTQWRRAATSLCACAAVAPQIAMPQIEKLFSSKPAKTDAGVVASLLAGIPRVALRDEDMARAILEKAIPYLSLDAADSMLDAEREGLLREAWVSGAVAIIERLGDNHQLSANADADYRMLQSITETDVAAKAGPALANAQLQRALAAYADTGTAAALRYAVNVSQTIDATITDLEDRLRHYDESMSVDIQVILRGLSRCLFERASLHEVLSIDDGKRAGASKQAQQLAGLTDFFVSADRIVSHDPLLYPKLTQFALRLVDSDGTFADDKVFPLRDRRGQFSNVLLQRWRDKQKRGVGPTNADARVIDAMVARLLDALMREGALEISDIVFVALAYAPTADDVRVLAQATAMPHLPAVFAAIADLELSLASQNVEKMVGALEHLRESLPVASSPRVEALRKDILVLQNACVTLDATDGLEQLLGSAHAEAPLGHLADAVDRLRARMQGALHRLGENIDASDKRHEPSAALISALTMDIAHLRSGGSAARFESSLDKAIVTVLKDLPFAFAVPVQTALEGLRQLPLESTASTPPRSTYRIARNVVAFPAWIPPNRKIGSFFLKKPLGSGAGGSVFVALRHEQKHHKHAEHFALKVPDFRGSAADMLSEKEFLRLFREEAGALLTVPEHENLSGFVTFDARTEPKPILVMELINGPSLDQFLAARSIRVADAFHIALGIASGLATMHRVGVGHFDIKPGNVILRPDTRNPMGYAPVLVDFGLAGRNLRPGCGTIEYGGPELWGMIKPTTREPLKADVYALACLVYELLSGKVLFSGESPIEIMAGHSSHNGLPSELQRWAEGSGGGSIADVLKEALNPEPAARPSMMALQAKLRELAPDFSTKPWPLTSKHS